jgi:acyl-CoA thioesterase
MAEVVPKITPQRVADAMFARDHAAQKMGISIENCAAGTATAAMRVAQDMLNGHAVCHGGFIFTLADTAFAYACNGANFNTVAAGCTIEFLASAMLGDALRAVACERVQHGRHGVYDIDVFNQNNVLIAVFRGKSARIAGHVIDEEARNASEQRSPS